MSEEFEVASQSSTGGFSLQLAWLGAYLPPPSVLRVLQELEPEGANHLSSSAGTMLIVGGNRAEPTGTDHHHQAPRHKKAWTAAHALPQPIEVTRVKGGKVTFGLTDEVRQLLALNAGRALALSEIMLALSRRVERCEVTPILHKLLDRGQVRRLSRFDGRRVVNVWQWVETGEMQRAA